MIEVTADDRGGAVLAGLGRIPSIGRSGRQRGLRLGRIAVGSWSHHCDGRLLTGFALGTRQQVVQVDLQLNLKSHACTQDVVVLSAAYQRVIVALVSRNIPLNSPTLSA